jgi:Mn2+/Fe2+ NRAMP family transporter
MSSLVLTGNYDRVEKVFMLMAAIFLVYPVAAFLTHPNLVEITRGFIFPKLSLQSEYILLIVGLVGTTISPYQQIFEQSAVIEKGITRKHFGPERWDSGIGMVFSGLITVFIIITTAATLHTAGITNINTAADAAKALQPVLGPAAKALFAIGIVGAGLMAAVVVAISTSFAFTGAFGLQEGIGLNIKSAPVFYGLFLFQVFLAAALSLLPGLPAFRILVLVQILNGMLLPFVLVFVLLLANNQALMGALTSPKTYTLLGWATFAIITISVIAGLTFQILPTIGIQLPGSM